MDDFTFWMFFVSAAIILNISPGPDLIYIISRTLSHGARVGLASAIGVCSGALIHVLAAAAGISAILKSSEIAFVIAKFIGAGYLVFLGIQALRSTGVSFETDKLNVSTKISPWLAFKQGVLVDALNPKVAIFFMAFLPQFVREDHGSVPTQLITLGLITIAIAIVIESFVVFLAARLTNYLQSNPSVSIRLDRIFGCILMVLAIQLVLTEWASI
ncbi:LysE family translocator [Nitrincola nitratireducens]|uniref:Homoserine/homoserine lactone efflux protein n=1 Tax=Nitrincola nitratireducens TaxID=1229521 RepID=W9UY63_9GAMM|nr:LysE family translocator [Nitrincola nitratireducens]EXJ09666.1 Homoserine/homoserine lactone efflux protein [Nitrincola nitratireducens]